MASNTKFEQMINDPEFLALPEEHQNQLVDEMKQKDFGTVPKTESFLERAMGIAGRAGSSAFKEATQGRFSQAPGMQGYMAGEAAKGSIMHDIAGENNPVGEFGLNVASDPVTYAGIGASKNIPGVFKKVFPYTSAESRVGFTKGIENSLVKRRGALTRGYGSALNKSKGIVDISDIVDEGSEITKLTMKEAQDLKNAISNGIPEAVKKGLKIDPKHFFDRNVAGRITEAMKKADPEMAQTIEKYGKHAENFKSAIAPIKSAKGPENIFGSNLISQMFGSGGKIPEKAMVGMKEFAPNVAKKVGDAKVNENIFRTLRGATIGSAAYKFVPSVLKRAFLSEVSGG